jgi:hypothetical protein
MWCIGELTAEYPARVLMRVCYKWAMKLFALLLSLLLLLPGCAASPTVSSCSSDMGTPMRMFELYFGRAVDGRGDVTDAEWKTFRDEFISPNLPSGYTVLDGTGAWMNPQTHTTVTETTKILIVATPDTAASLAAVQRVRSAYETEFKQISVGMTTRLACGSFD